MGERAGRVPSPSDANGFTNPQLMVCRRWHTLVVNDPQMWNLICIDVPEGGWDMSYWASYTLPFITKCLKRSQTAPLHITLNLECLLSVRDHIHERLVTSLSHYPMFKHDSFVHWLGRLDYGDLEEDEDMTGDCQPDHVLSLLRTFIGDGAVMERWKSLEIYFPYIDDDLASYIWDILDHPLPNLSQARFFHLSHLDGLQRDQIFSQTPNFSNVKRLRVSGLDNWELISFFPPSLEELSVHIIFDQNFLFDLSRFDKLRVLKISRGKLDYPATVDPVGPTKVILPHLQELGFSGRFQRLDRVEFRLPILQQLSLKWEHKDVLKEELPNLQPLRVHWSSTEPIDGSYARDLAKDALGRILQQFTGSELLSVPLSEREILSELLMELSRNNVLCWKHVSFYKGKTIVETTTIQEILRNT
jgi:hypothetical protein